MTSICFFSSYSESTTIALYVRVYLEELNKHFSKVAYITNTKTLDNASIAWLNEQGITLTYVTNEGYDFGMWLKAFNTHDMTQYDRVALVNDSCILFKPLDELIQLANNSACDYYGIIASLRFGYHIQSFFIIINKNAISYVHDYFKQTGIVSTYKEAIYKYEIGLSQYLVQHGMKLGAAYEDITLNTPYNPSFYQLPQLIAAGMPMIKKKIIFRSYRPLEYIGLLKMEFRIDERPYIKLIENKQKSETTPTLINLSELAHTHTDNANRWDIYLYNSILTTTHVLRKFWVFRFLYTLGVRLKRRIFNN